MTWKGLNIPEGTKHEVGFGFSSACKTVVAWYCPNKPQERDPNSLIINDSRRRLSESSEKINKRTILNNVCSNLGECSDSDYVCTKDGWDKCYNEMTADAHNEKRTTHCATNPFKVDAEMAKELQKIFSKSQKRTKKEDRPAKYKDCFENFYEGYYPETE